MLSSISYRSPWPEGTQTGGGFPEPSDSVSQRAHRHERLGSGTAQLRVPTAGETARAQDAVHSRLPAHLLP